MRPSIVPPIMRDKLGRLLQVLAVSPKSRTGLVLVPGSPANTWLPRRVRPCSLVLALWETSVLCCGLSLFPPQACSACSPRYNTGLSVMENGPRQHHEGVELQPERSLSIQRVCGGRAGRAVCSGISFGNSAPLAQGYSGCNKPCCLWHCWYPPSCPNTLVNCRAPELPKQGQLRRPDPTRCDAPPHAAAPLQIIPAPAWKCKESKRLLSSAIFIVLHVTSPLCQLHCSLCSSSESS